MVIVRNIGTKRRPVELPRNTLPDKKKITPFGYLLLVNIEQYLSYLCRKLNANSILGGPNYNI